MYIAIEYNDFDNDDTFKHEYQDYINILYKNVNREILIDKIVDYSEGYGYEYEINGDNIIFYDDSGDEMRLRIEIKEIL